MCGIVGIVKTTGTVDPSLIDSMCDAIQHRGPDERGRFVEARAALGMTRLSIIDLSAGQQPIFNEDSSLVIVFNGEIYNYRSLRNMLIEKGHQFRTGSDTETILHLYEEYGEDCVELLQGMFAFAVWDRREKKLFIARDRLGIKPLYYFWDGETFLFGSEPESLFCYPGLKRELDHEAVESYFTYLYVPAEGSCFRHVQKLLPGCSLTLCRGDLEIQRYYSLNTPIESESWSESEWIERIVERTERVVDKHLVSDVPVGVFLSGGVDSSLVGALMRRSLTGPFDSFAVGYDKIGASFDETAYARQVANLLGTDHHELIISAEDVADELPTILSALDEPFGNASIIPSYCLSRFARERVKVVLSGLGGDELCGGYERHLAALIAERHPLLTKLLSSKPVRQALMCAPDSRTGAHFQERIKRFALDGALPLMDRYFGFVSRFNAAEREQLFSRAFRHTLDGDGAERLFSEMWRESASYSALTQLLTQDMRTSLTDDLLALSDRTSMAHGLEMRVPLVDHTLVELFRQVPDRLKIKGITKKYLLKRVAEQFLPSAVVHRKKKGFSVPLSVWFRGALRPYVEELLAAPVVESIGIFEPKYVTSLLEEHFSAKRNHDEKIFALLAFMYWHKRNFSAARTVEHRSRQEELVA